MSRPLPPKPEALALRGLVHRPAAPVSYADRGVEIERRVALFLIVFLAYGVFFPPETYFTVRTFALNQEVEASSGPYYGRYGYALALVWLIYQFSRHLNVMLGAIRRAWLPITLCLIALLSAFWAPDFGGSANRSFRMLIITLFAVYLVRRFERGELVALLTKAMGIAIAASIFAVIAFPTYGLSNFTGYGGAWNGALGTKNALGALMSVGAVIGYHALVGRAVTTRLAWAVCLFCFTLTILSQSATSLVALFVPLPFIYLFAFIRTIRRIGHRTLTLIFGFALFAVVGLVVSSVKDMVFSLLGRNADLTGREIIWQTTWATIQNNPIQGYGHTFWSYESPLRTDLWTKLGFATPQAHNMFLDVWLQLGISGLIVMISILFLIIVRCIRSLIINPTLSGCFCFVLFIQICIQSITESSMLDGGIAGMFWLTVAYAIMAEESTLNTNSESKKYP